MKNIWIRFCAWVIDYSARREKREWIFSGVIVGHNNALADGGFFRSPRPMTRAKALRYLRDVVPRGNVTHVDDINCIITFKLL